MGHYVSDSERKFNAFRDWVLAILAVICILLLWKITDDERIMQDQDKQLYIFAGMKCMEPLVDPTDIPEIKFKLKKDGGKNE